MTKIILLGVFCVVLTITGFGQAEKQTSPQNIVELQRIEMKKLDQWVGQWQGTGWIEQEKGKEIFAGTETVQRKLNGLALLVEGKFKNEKDVVIHETLAILSSNQKSKNYDFNTFLANGMKGLQELKGIEGGWQWSLEFPSGSIRYTIKINNNTWSEIGEITMDGGKNWRKFFEMNLKKIK